jgi:Flp pilus assembly pilin Flp
LAWHDTCNGPLSISSGERDAEGDDTAAYGDLHPESCGRFLVLIHTPESDTADWRRDSKHDQRRSLVMRRLLKDESGQTMLEYIVIVVFVVIAAIIAFRLVKNIVKRNIDRVSASFDTD